MRHYLLLLPVLALTATAAAAQQGTENRCGWYSNPSPANHWLTDRTRQWLIGAQGGYQARGIDLIGDSTQSQWVATHPNGSYGYGCACARVRTDPRNSQITRIYSWRAVPLAQCRGDRRLREPRD